MTAGEADTSRRRAQERLLQEVRRVSGPLLDEALRRITQELPDYASALGETELRRTFAGGFELVARLLTEDRGPDASELARLARVGAQRAEAGVPVTDVVRAYRLGFLVVWEGLTREARARGVPDDGWSVRLWWVHDSIAATVEEGHRARAAQLADRGDERGQELLAALRDRLPTAAALAAAAGLHAPAVCVARASGASGRSGTFAVVVPEPEGVVVLAPGTDPEPLARRLRDLGWEHVGAACAASTSSSDPVVAMAGALRAAERAHAAACATGQAQVLADRDWFTCLVAGSDVPEDLAALAALLGEDPGLAETVLAFLSADRNLTHAAARLHVHPNTVAYRLRRVSLTTGLDLRTLDGLLRGCAALTLLGLDPLAEPDARLAGTG